MAAPGAAAGDFRCGHIAIVGRPNVGKSTLLNLLVGHKISITSRRPQTTRWQILGLRNTPRYQAAFVDTPGVQTRYTDAVYRHMGREVSGALQYVDIVFFVIDAARWRAEDEHVRRMLEPVHVPIVLVVNKIDRLRDRSRLLPMIAALPGADAYEEIVPVSARTSDGIETLDGVIARLLPPGAPLYPGDSITDRNERFLAAEFIREKLTTRLGGEVPYRISVTVESFRRRGAMTFINAVIWVESAGQKSMVIGHNGELLKSVGIQARKDMERLFSTHVHLEIWVKVRRHWRDDVKSLREFGYTR